MTQGIEDEVATHIQPPAAAPHGSATPPRSALSRTLAAARYLLVMLLISTVMLEVAARLLTHTGADGIMRFRSVALLPYRLDEAHVRQTLDEMRTNPLLMRDPELGFTVRPNKSDDGNKTNAQGVRADPNRLFSTRPHPGKLRIATMGDSFVYCSEVDNGQTWQDYLERRRSDLEVLNFGVPGSGTDQAMLRWTRDARPLNAHIAVLGIWPDNMFRNLSVLHYYRAHADIALAKPRMARDAAGQWRFVNAPVLTEDQQVDLLAHPEGKAILEHEYWFNPDDAATTLPRRLRTLQIAQSVWRRYQTQQIHHKIYSGEVPDGIDVTLAIASRFAAEARQVGSIPLVLMIPDRQQLAMHTGEKPYPLVQALRAAGLDVIDMGPTFGAEVAREGPANYYVGGVGHHSPMGNEVFAQHLERELGPWIEKARTAASSH